MRGYAVPRIRSGYVLRGDPASKGECGCVARPPKWQKCGHSARLAATQSHAGRFAVAPAELAVEIRVHLPPVLPTPASLARPVVSPRAQPSPPLPEIPRAPLPAPNATALSQLHLEWLHRACSPRSLSVIDGAGSTLARRLWSCVIHITASCDGRHRPLKANEYFI